MKKFFLASILAVLYNTSYSQNNEGFFGEKFSITELEEYISVRENIYNKSNYNVKIEGEILSSCPMKGCWMKIRAEKERNPRKKNLKEELWNMPWIKNFGGGGRAGRRGGRSGKEGSRSSLNTARALMPAALNCSYSATENPVRSTCPPLSWARRLAPPPV